MVTEFNEEYEDEEGKDINESKETDMGDFIVDCCGGSRLFGTWVD